MKKVLLVAPLPPPYGGISHWTAMVLEHSREPGKIPLQVVDTAPRQRTIFDRSFYKRVVLGIPGLLGQTFRLLKVLPSKELLALHVTTPGRYALARDVGFILLGRLFRRRSILHLRLGRVPALLDSRGIESFTLRLGLKVASHVIAIDRSTAKAIKESLPTVTVTMVPNCIDSSALPDVPAQKSQTILFVGWVLPAKGIEELLAAWEYVSQPDWRLKIIGPYSTEYFNELSKRHNVEKVEFVGECDNSTVLAEMAKAAVLCLPSHTEGFPNVVLEAMALRCAVVATPVGAIPEMLADGAGVIVAEKDSIALADQLLALMHDSAARERVATRAIERVRTEYMLDSVYESYEAIWRGENRE